MSDIYLGLAVILALSLGVLALTLWLTRTASTRVLNVLGAGAFVLLLLCAWVIRDNVFLSRLLPFSNLIVLGNWLPLATALLAAIGWRRIPGGVARKCLYLVPLAALALYSFSFPLRGQTPTGADSWSEGVSLQTSMSSCSAACAATLLRAHGIDTSEQEMIPLCLTRTTGTTWYGLYRGLKQKTVNRPFEVEMFSCSLEELQQLPPPVILSVRLDPRLGLDERYQNKWGWEPGIAHAVVLFGFHAGGGVEMGDPSIGRENWDLDALKTLWHGDGMRLVRKPTPAP